MQAARERRKRRMPRMAASHHLLHWYAARMGELLPLRFRARAFLPDATLVLLPLYEDGTQAEVLLRRRGQEAALGRVALTALPRIRRRPRRLLLRAPTGLLLERDVVL